MRTAHWKAHLLPLLLLLLYSVSVCLAGGCGFDDYVRDFGRPNTVTAKAQTTGKDWEPIRIVTSTKDLQVTSKYCTNNGGLIYERGTKNGEADCENAFIILNAEKTKIATGILERAIALHTDRLLVKRAVGPLVIPPFSSYPLCRYFNFPAEHHTTGVANADMVLYVGVSSRPIGDNGAPSLGVMCAKSTDGRPIAGTIYFGPYDMDISRHTVRFTAHQIAHALGFSYSEMNSRKMIVDKTVRGKPNQVAVVKSDKTKKMAQEHYGCSTADGMELEDGESNNEKLSHWERRNAKDELMAKPIGARGTSFMGFYTNLTLAAFEDMGFYKANFTMAEDMIYGQKAGCEFLTGKCMENGKTKWPKMFCDDPKPNEGSYVCTTDRLGMGVCAFGSSKVDLPAHFQYFASGKKGGLAASLTDYCPVVEPLHNSGCRSNINPATMPGSIVGVNSVCLDGSALKVKTKSGTVPVGGVCAAISCEGGSLKVMYHDDSTNKWHDCPEGKSLTPSSTSKSFVSGAIKCPKYKEVCTVAPDGSTFVPKVKGQSQKDSSAVPFGFIPSVAFLVLSFAGYLIA